MQKLPISTVKKINELVDKATGKVLSGLRRDLRVSQQDASEWMGWADRSTLSRIEVGRRPVDLRELVRFAQLYHVTPEALMADITREYRGRQERSTK